MKQIININYLFKVCVLLLVSALLTACISPPNIKYTKGESFDLLTTTSAESSIVIFDKDNTFVFCSEPTSNISINSGDSLSLSGTVGGTKDSASGSIGATESAPLGSTSNVLLTREILYRTCEFISNSSLSEKEKLDLFIKALDSVTSINNGS